jgi:hypothetical protein
LTEPFVVFRIFAQRYFAEPASRSDGAMALTMIFFSAGVSSRCPTLLSGGGASVPDDCAEDDGASGVADGGANGEPAHALSATLAASNAMALYALIRTVRWSRR